MTKKNLVLSKKEAKPIIFDAFYQKTGLGKPLVIFCHGYKGFKDWGAWDLVANAFMEAGCFFVKFNFSHNGGTLEQPFDFPDLNAFAENNYSKELEDLENILNHILSTEEYQNELDSKNISLIGHSRGGGIVTIKAAEDSRITKVITWAGISSLDRFDGFDLEAWKREGVVHVLNGRTKQQMPHNFQFYKDYINNEVRLNIKKAVQRLEIPHLIIHAKDDQAVAFSEAESLHSWNTRSELKTITKSNHVFNCRHPWTEDFLPEQLKQVVDSSISLVNDLPY
ncbi:MAG: prolyl oligopeptidase family serine peptidase [Bacteroidia bacterium]|nr:prolyl oligopeptidase family serine peptidase [Bacteroidia bacterium]NND10165.1 prolyl oligopeptidase family serine peptidase [Flavobacteriaceae bacterium]NNL80475.1 prolyl oligopeptidase family serine peptidase [Flavobacteriaceae bacterium]